MIAKSDIVILSAASALLLIALLRLDGPSSELRTSTYYTPKKNVVAPAANTNTAATSSNTTETRTALNSTQETPSNQATQVETTASIESGTNTAPATTDTVTPAVVEPDPEFTTHIVKQGEYLGLIARRYDTTVAELKKLNNLQGNIILVGQELIYPAN